MEQSIISFLEEDEDESKHSGADVEALTAALNRDIEGYASTSQPSDSESVLSHGSNPTSNQLFAQCQSSIKEEIIVSENQQEGVKNIQPQVVPHGSDVNNQQQHIKCSLKHSQLPSQHKRSHDDQPPRPAEQNLPQLSQKSVVQKFEQNTIHFPEPGRIQHPDNQNQYPKLQKMNNQQPPTAVTANNPLTRNKVVHFGLLLPLLTPNLDKDRVTQLDTLFTKLRKNEINKEGFIRLVRNIVGDELLRMAVFKVHAQAARNSITRPHQLTSLQQHPQADSSFPTMEKSTQKSRETEQADSQRMNVTQVPSVSMNIPTNPLCVLNKQHQLTHLHLPQKSIPMYGDPISNYHTHPYSGPPITGATTPFRPHIQGSQRRPVSLHQVSSTQSGGASQSLNIMSAPKYEMQTSTTEAKRLHGGHYAQSTNNSTMQHNASVWQSSMNKEQKISTLSSMGYVKQKVVVQTQELPPKSQLSASPGSSSFGAARLDHGNTSSPAILKDDVLEKQCSRVPSSTSITALQTNLASGSTATQVDPSLLLPSSTTSLGAGVNVKTLPKKPSIGQKKPSDALETPPTVACKKQKLSGAFLDRSIGQLNDVTAVSRASEVTRRVVQKEEERLIFQGSQMRPVSLHQVSSTQSGGASQSLNIMSAPKYEMQTSTTEAKRLHGGHYAQSTNNSTMQHNASVWQSSMNREQKISTLSSMAYVKQKVVVQTQELPPKSQLSASPDSSSFGAARLDHGNTSSPATLKDDVMEKQCSRVPSSTSITALQTNLASGSTATQVDPSLLLPSSTTSLGAGVSVKTLPKKPSIGQKKLSDALETPPTVARKKPKLSGAFLDRSIGQLNDVTAVSGVNLREEEEQLFSGPKEDSKASEATRRVVQQEEERLIFHKNPFQKKLAKILSRCGIKSISNDVEMCLSLCVEERMRGLISNLIRLSKQRVDIEKPRHRVLITSDVRRQILFMNRKAKEDLSKKQAGEVVKINEAEGNIGADKMRATAANVAARVAVGGNDMLSKWQLLAEQARQKREGGTYVASAAQSSKDASRKSLSASGRTMRDNQDGENRGFSTSGTMRKFGRNSVMQHTKIARSVSIKDVIAVLEREPQMSNSTLIYRLYEGSHGDFAAAE